MTCSGIQQSRLLSAQAGRFSIFGSDIHCAELRYDYSETALSAMKQHAQVPEKLQGAVTVRQIDFMAGRMCAVQALRQAGCSHPGSIPIGTSGEPIWPSDFVGAISHSGGWAIAVAANRRIIRALGVDVEQGLSPEVARQIQGQVAHAGELSLGDRHCFLPETWLTILFSAKESLFKALYADVGRYFDFLDAEAQSLDAENGTLTLILRNTLSRIQRQGMSYTIFFRQFGNWILTSCILHEPQTCPASALHSSACDGLVLPARASTLTQCGLPRIHLASVGAP